MPTAEPDREPEPEPEPDPLDAPTVPARPRASGTRPPAGKRTQEVALADIQRLQFRRLDTQRD